MEQNMPGITKKIWNIMRVAYFMLKKGLCKRKILMDLNMMMKRGKIAGKALHNLKFHLHHHNQDHHAYTSQVGLTNPSNLQHLAMDAPREYEFSCSNTPLYRHYFTNKKKTHQHQNFMPSPLEDINNIEAVNEMFDMMMLSCNNSLAPSPALGFGRSPAVQQLRITDSPFPLQNTEDNKHVDEAADDFIKKFYSQLKQQKNY